MEVKDIVGEKLAGLVDDGELAARAQAGVDPENGDRTGGCGQQKVLEVVAKDLNRVGVGAVLELETQLALNRGVEETFPCVVVDGELKMRGPVPCPAENASAKQRDGAKGFEFDEEVEDGSASRSLDTHARVSTARKSNFKDKRFCTAPLIEKK